ncbi:ankyrin repeat domain-containing protein [Hymenobacter sp. BT188]|uniref:ankyrin repeat domain-containing protein n=1 Tax=Hymenobacter sp. BT188 TaxID=2763504 RepID=UPI0016518B19|nr:ankyrin repeat domain-containing protein [Hymenobacter sp. BT188]MBC6605522.1 ankyrin repeat domain-containing protein [Hymenobacter sp. BT188]
MKKIALFCLLFMSLAYVSAAQDKSKELYTAVLKSNTTAVETLLKTGADPNHVIEIVPGFPTSYLIAAATNNNVAIVKSLLQYKAKINWRDAFQATALHYAAGKGSKELIELLLASGADLQAKDEDGNTALTSAKAANNKEVVTLLEAKTKS